MKQAFKGVTYTSTGGINRIKHYYSLATNTELNDGLKWYGKANDFCKALATIHNVPLIQVAGIVAALSPQQSWETNQKQAKQFLQSGKANGATKVRLQKCFDILDTQDENEILEILSKGGKFLKTRKFFINIYAPLRRLDATIDRHAVGVVTQSANNVQAIDENFRQMTAKQYKFIEHCYIRAAELLNICPCELQAITWTVYRRLRELSQHKEVLPF